MFSLLKKPQKYHLNWSVWTWLDAWHHLNNFVWTWSYPTVPDGSGSPGYPCSSLQGFLTGCPALSHSLKTSGCEHEWLLVSLPCDDLTIRPLAQCQLGSDPAPSLPCRGCTVYGMMFSEPIIITKRPLMKAKTLKESPWCILTSWWFF